MVIKIDVWNDTFSMDGCWKKYVANSKQCNQHIFHFFFSPARQYSQPPSSLSSLWPLNLLVPSPTPLKYEPPKPPLYDIFVRLLKFIWNNLFGLVYEQPRLKLPAYIQLAARYLAIHDKHGIKRLHIPLGCNA